MMERDYPGPDSRRVQEMFAGVDLTGKVLPLHLISLGVEASLEFLKPAAVFVCTDDGVSARRHNAAYRRHCSRRGVAP